MRQFNDWLCFGTMFQAIICRCWWLWVMGWCRPVKILLHCYFRATTQLILGIKGLNAVNQLIDSALACDGSTTWSVGCNNQAKIELENSIGLQSGKQYCSGKCAWDAIEKGTAKAKCELNHVYGWNQHHWYDSRCLQRPFDWVIVNLYHW